MRSVLERIAGTTASSRAGTVFILAGLALLLYSAGAYLGLLPGGYPSVPEPAALSGSGQRSARLSPPPTVVPTTESAAAIPPAASPEAAGPATVSPPPKPQPEPAVVLTPMAKKADAADATDRLLAAHAGRPGTPLRLQIEGIGVDAEVKEAGIVPGRNGEPEWQTLPFVAAHYPMLGPVGAAGNPVISGHVVTLYEGNVFRDLYRVALGDEVAVFTEDSRFRYLVEEIKLVEPDDVSVMAPSDDARLTLVTCGGTFDPRTTTFSERLIVVAKLVGGERL